MKRGRNQRRRQGGSNPNRALDSNGPDVRIRGTANQIYDKYTALARDASSAGDRIKAENYLQHAEHYFRVIRANQPPQPQQSNPESDSEQPSAEDGDNRGDERRSSGRGDRNRDNRRNNPRNDRNQDEDANVAEDKKESESGGDEPVKADSPESSESDNADGEAKPKRKRAPRRTTKRVAKEANDEEKADDDAAATAAQ